LVLLRKGGDEQVSQAYKSASSFTQHFFTGGKIDMKQIINFFKDEDGAAIPEYALILGVVAAVTVGFLIAIGNHAETIFSAVSGKMATASGSIATE
jgi:Flp pilus assembly pilin Flp